MGFTTDFGLRRPPDWRETIALTDSSVDGPALLPAMRWAAARQPGDPPPTEEQFAEVPHLRALWRYYSTGDPTGIPVREGAEPPTRIRYRPLTVIERAAIDSVCRRVVPGAAGVRVEMASSLRAALAFAVGCEVVGLPATVPGDNGRSIATRQHDPALGLDRLSDRALAGIAEGIGHDMIEMIGGFVLRGSEAALGDTFRGGGNGVARDGGSVQHVEVAVDPVVPAVPGGPEGGGAAP